MTADLFLSQLPLIEQVVRFVARGCRREEAEEFASLARLKLIEDDYAVLRRFAGRSSLRTYLTVVLQRLFLDHRTQRWGRYRPSAPARRLGGVAVRLETLLARDGLSFEEACETLRTNEGVAETPEALAALAGRLPPRHGRRRFEGEEALADLSVSAEATVVAPALAGESDRAAEAVRAALGRALAGLPDQDRLIVKMRFEDGFSVVQIAAVLHLEAKPVYKRMDRLLERLRTSLEAEGIQAGDALASLEAGAC